MIVEIIILIIGILCIIAGFAIPDNSHKVSDKDIEKDSEKIKEYIDVQLEKRKFEFEESLDSKVQDALDKAERSMERVSNEKIMAVTEFGDTVLSDININHEEAVFLYNMLNEKHDELIKSQNEIESASKEARTIIDSFETVKNDSVKENIEDLSLSQILKEDFPDEKIDDAPINLKETKKTSRKAVKRNPESVTVTNLGGNHNDEIIRLYKEGKSNVAIAKELGLGVGEVKLVIDLANM